MASDAEEQKIVETFPVREHLSFQRSDGMVEVAYRESVLSPATIEQANQHVAQHISERFGEPRCLLTLEDISVSKAEEHIILQSLGARWIAFAPGFVNDRVNNENHGREGRFANRGPLGVLLPFYLRRRKEMTFEYDGKRIVFESVPNTGFRISLHGLKMPEGKTDGPGFLRFQLPTEPLVARDTSRVVHKMCYLGLCLVAPEIGLEAALNPCREFIVVGGPEFRPFVERFVPGAEPGFSLDLFHLGRVEEQTGRKLVQAIDAVIKIHHMVYCVSLLGDSVAHRNDAIRDPDFSVSSMTVEFGFDALLPASGPSPS